MPVYYGNDKVKPIGIKDAYFGDKKIYHRYFKYNRYLPYRIDKIVNAANEDTSGFWHLTGTAAIVRPHHVRQDEGGNVLPPLTSDIPIQKIDGKYQFILTDNVSKESGINEGDVKNKYFQVYSSGKLRLYNESKDNYESIGYIESYSNYRYYSTVFTIVSDVKGEFVDKIELYSEITNGIHDLGDGAYYYEKIA